MLNGPGISHNQIRARECKKDRPVRK